tara:strand:- start:4641 stop:5954 length:1314 start_codon:yes stop_codon:yes gene_type:complete
MKSTRQLVSVLFFAAYASLSAQMSLDEAIEIALQQNYSLQISSNKAKASQNTAKPGQAGLIPLVSATASSDYGNDNTNMVFSGENPALNVNNAESINLASSLRIDYTLFAGGSNRGKYKKLKLNADLSSVQNRLEIETTLIAVIASYFNVLRATDNYKALNETLTLSSERLQIAEKQRAYSGGSRANVLSAQVDLNKDSVTLVQANQALDAAKIAFNKTINRDLSSNVNLENIPFIRSEISDYAQLKELMFSQNNQVQSARLNLQNSLLDYKISKASYLPQLNLTGSYSFNKSETEGSFITLNESNGLGILFSLNIPIYAGGTKRAAVKNAALSIKNREWELKESKLALEANLMTAYSDFERTLEIVLMEEKNVALNLENFKYTQKEFEVGLLSSNAYRLAQINLLLVKNNYNNSRYNMILSEMEVLRLSGKLIAKF